MRRPDRSPGFAGRRALGRRASTEARRRDGTYEALLSSQTRVLLVEHVDATGAAPADARARAVACREAGFAVETLVLDSLPGDDLQFPERGERTGTTIDVLVDDERGRAQLRARIRASRADRVLWASACTGGGALAAEVVGERPASWWPTGHPGTHGSRGTLAALDPAFAPAEGCAWDADRTPRGRLALWDGPFVLVPARPSPASARLLLQGFAEACRDRDELDLVVLDHPRPEIESLARQSGVSLRVHFVGPAPREAELAWLATARAALVTGDAPLSGGLLLRALGAGLPVLAAGAPARPIGAWLEHCGAGPSARESARDLADALGGVLDRASGDSPWRQRARAAAAAHHPGALAARLAAALGEAGAKRRAA